MNSYEILYRSTCFLRYKLFGSGNYSINIIALWSLALGTACFSSSASTTYLKGYAYPLVSLEPGLRKGVGYESKCQEKLIYEMITDLYEKLDDVKRRSSNERFHKTV